MNIDKLVEAIQQAVQKAGGEAARIWPDMVASYALSCLLAAVGMSLLGVGLGIAAVALFRVTNSTKDDMLGGLTAAGTIVCAMAAIILCVAAVAYIPDAVYPEAGLVRSLLRR